MRKPNNPYLRELSEMAAVLVNTPAIPPESMVWRKLAAEAQAYHMGVPYPAFAFHNWRTEQRGVVPIVQPFVKGIPRTSAKWLFGKPIELICEDSEDWQEFMRSCWQSNRMPTRMVAEAETAAVTGACGLKFDYDESRPDCPVRISTLKPWHYTCFRHPHDAYIVLMVRIQYPIWNPEEQRTEVYREEWTADEFIQYEPQTTAGLGVYDWMSPAKPWAGPLAYETKDWTIKKREPNKFGVIPFVDIWNIDRGTGYGHGDLFGFYRAVDRVNLARYLEDLHNQKNVDPKVAFIDLTEADDEQEHVTVPGEPVLLQSSSTEKQGKIEQMHPQSEIRAHLRTYAIDIKRELYHAVGSVEVNEEEVTNKGNLTAAVLMQLYHSLILSTEEKRKCGGEDGVCKFFETMAEGLANFGAKEAAGVSDDCDVTISWPDYFDLTDEDKFNRVNRYQMSVSGGFMPKSVAVRKVAQMEGIQDIEEYEDQVEIEDEERLKESQELAKRNRRN